MKIFLKALLISLLATNLVACMSQLQPKKTSSQRPAWIDNPQTVGEVVGLGQSGYHMNGRAAQRELATRRALDDIARQLGVTVSNETTINQQSTNLNSKTNMNSDSVHSVNGRVVNALVHDEWQDGDTLYIIMVGR